MKDFIRNINLYLGRHGNGKEDMIKLMVEYLEQTGQELEFIEFLYQKDIHMTDE